MSAAELALGSAQFGLAYGIAGRGEPVPQTELTEILACARAQNVRVIDTAPAYGDAEVRLGACAGNAEFDFVSKIAALPRDCDSRQAAQFVARSIAQSRERLGGALRTLLFHRGADLLKTHGEVAWKTAVNELHGTKIALGVSCYSPMEIKSVLERFPITVAQVPGNALDQRLAWTNGLAGVEIHLRSVFLQGLLLMPASVAAAKLPKAAVAVESFGRWCLDRGLSQLEAALGIAKTLPGVRYCIVGVDRKQQLQDVISAWTRVAPIHAASLESNDPEVIDPRAWRTT